MAEALDLSQMSDADADATFKPANINPATKQPLPNGAIDLANPDPNAVGKIEYGIDFSRPVPAVRADIAKLPDDRRTGALNAWADHYVANENKRALCPAERSLVRS